MINDSVVFDSFLRCGVPLFCLSLLPFSHILRNFLTYRSNVHIYLKWNHNFVSALLFPWDVSGRAEEGSVLFYETAVRRVKAVLFLKSISYFQICYIYISTNLLSSQTFFLILLPEFRKRSMPWILRALNMDPLRAERGRL